MPLRSSRSVAVAVVTLATFTDMIAYSVAVPVLPDLSRTLGASPTVIGVLFASFGVTLLSVSLPMGAVSDRIGRKAPLAGGLVALAAASLLFAFADRLLWLFAARLVQGAADAVTWVVGFALIADLYGPTERGRVTGLVMSGTGVAFMIGPSLGGWLYEIGGMRLPFVTVAAMATLGALAVVWLQIPAQHADRELVPVGAILRIPAAAECALAVAVASATISMLEPVLALQLDTLGINPARVGLVFGVAAMTTALLHPAYGRMADRWGARRMTLCGLMLSACVLPILGRTWSFESAVVFYILQAAAVALVITPSLAYMAEVASSAGLGSLGVAFGLYNVAWGVGLLAGPALGGFLFERMGFEKLALAWAPCVIVVTLLLGRREAQSVPGRASPSSVRDS